MKSLSTYLFEASAGSITPANKRWGVTPKIQNEISEIIDEFSKHMGEKLIVWDHLWKRERYYSKPWREAFVRFDITKPDEAKRYDKFISKLYKEFAVQGKHTGDAKAIFNTSEMWKDEPEMFDRFFDGKDFGMINNPFVLEGTNTQINGVKTRVTRIGGYYDIPLEKMVVEITFRIINTEVNLQ